MGEWPLNNLRRALTAYEEESAACGDSTMASGAALSGFLF